MRRFRMAAVLAAVPVLTAGCGGGLLSRDEYVRALMARNRELEKELLGAEERLAALKADGARPAPRPEPPDDPFRPVAVRFGQYTTVLEGEAAGETGRLKVVLEPLDAEGDVVKRAGRLRLRALLPGRKEGEEPEPFHTWTFPPEDLARTWIGSLGIRAYVLKLRWPEGRRPRGPTLRLRAAFTTLEGEVLTAETRLPLKAEP